MIQPDRLAAALADRYRIERELGAGGMATVYLAADLKHDRRVAIKVLKSELAAVLGAERFVQEIKTTAALSHPHILPLFDSGEAGGFLYYVMPYIEGETVREKLTRETQFGIEEAVKITTEVADALDYAHRHGVIHRDIKPENILLHDGRPMVMDFGIALAVSAAAGGRMTETGLSLGTPHYMSPEQATADKQITARSDIYSLASVLYEMLTGEPPHMGTSAQQIIMKIIAEPVKPATELRKSVPEHVTAALMKALEKLPADRFASAREFAAALGDTSFTSVTGRAAGAARTGRPDRRILGLVAVSVLALTAAAWGWLRPTSKPIPSPWRVTLPLPDSAPMSYGLGFSDDGSVMAYGGPHSVGALLRRADGAGFVPIPGTRRTGNASLSPDGRRVAAIRDDGSLWVIPVDGGEPVRVADRMQITAPGAWHGSEAILFSGPDGILEYQVAGGAPRKVTTLNAAAGETFHLWPDAAPDGGVLFTTFTKFLMDSARIGYAREGSPDHMVIMPGVFARYAAPDTLLVLQNDGTIVVAPFDPRTGRVTGALTPVLRGLHPNLLSNDGRFAVSRNGRVVVAANGAVVVDTYDLVRVTRGGAVVPLDTSWTGGFLSAAISRDGTKVAVGTVVVGRWEIQVRDLRTRAQVRVSTGGILWENPSFTPAGDALLIDSLGVNGGGVFRVGLGAASAPERLWTPVEGTYPGTPRYSGDGATIYYSANDLASGAVSLRARSAASPEKDLETVANGDGEVSPDGRWVAYVSTESSAAGLYVRPRAAGSSERWLVASGETGLPRWAPGGRELVFSAGDSLYAVAVQGGQTFTVGARHAIVGLRGFRPAVDFFPNGDLLMMRQRAATGATSLLMIENWRAALKH